MTRTQTGALVELKREFDGFPQCTTGIVMEVFHSHRAGSGRKPIPQARLNLGGGILHVFPTAVLRKATL